MSSRAPRGTWFAGAALAVFAVIYALLVFYHEDLVGIDFAQLTAHRFVAMPIWPASGRFFPLAFQEYNVLALIGKNALVYHAFSMLELVVVLGCVYRLLDTTPRWFRCLVMMFLMALPSLVYSFFGLVYPERDMVLWLCVWLACMQSFRRTNGRAAFWGALLAAQLLLYYKETAFLLVGGFAGARVVMDVFVTREYRRIAKDHVLEMGLIALCAVYLGLYLVVIVPHIEATYAANAKVAGAAVSALKSYIVSDPLLDVFAIVVVARLAGIIVKKRAPDLLWDAAAVGALAYALAYVKLGLMRDYYMAPVDVIAALYIARLAFGALRVEQRRLIPAAALLVAFAFARNVSDAAYYVLARKEMVDGNVRVVRALADYAASHPNANLSLYFPEVGGFQLMEFSAFAQYKGLALGGVKSPHRFPGDRCQPSQDFRCIYAASAGPGELIVYLPGRQVPARELEGLRASAREILHYQPSESIVERTLRRLVPADRLADRATDAYVFSPPSS